MDVLTILVALGCLVGILGSIIQVYPGLLLVAGSVTVWGGITGG
ncbi:MAG: hypothetical protein Q4P36_05730 [Bowdeniella nasicola]|nr:hypothetical protein [Bowdeniella nasicola]